MSFNPKGDLIPCCLLGNKEGGRLVDSPLLAAGRFIPKGGLIPCCLLGNKEDVRLVDSPLLAAGRFILFIGVIPYTCFVSNWRTLSAPILVTSASNIVNRILCINRACCAELIACRVVVGTIIQRKTIFASIQEI